MIPNEPLLVVATKIYANHENVRAEDLFDS